MGGGGLRVDVSYFPFAGSREMAHCRAVVAGGLDADLDSGNDPVFEQGGRKKKEVEVGVDEWTTALASAYPMIAITVLMVYLIITETLMWREK